MNTLALSRRLFKDDDEKEEKSSLKMKPRSRKLSIRTTASQAQEKWKSYISQVWNVLYLSYRSEMKNQGTYGTLKYIVPMREKLSPKVKQSCT